MAINNEYNACTYTIYTEQDRDKQLFYLVSVKYYAVNLYYIINNDDELMWKLSRHVQTAQTPSGGLYKGHLGQWSDCGCMLNVEVLHRSYSLELLDWIGSSLYFTSVPQEHLHHSVLTVHAKICLHHMSNTQASPQHMLNATIVPRWNVTVTLSHVNTCLQHAATKHICTAKVLNAKVSIACTKMSVAHAKTCLQFSTSYDMFEMHEALFEHVS